MLAALALALSLTEWEEPPAGAVVALSFPALGRVTCEGRAPGTKPGRVEMNCRGPRGEALMHVDFFRAHEVFDGYVRLKEIRPAGMPTPLLLAVAVSTGGSDSSFETTLIGERSGQLVDLWPQHWITNVLDDLCVGQLGPGKAAGVAGFVFVWGHAVDEWHYAPHRYRATLYTWDGQGLAAAGMKVSQKRVPQWSDAAKDMGFACSGELHSFAELDEFR